MMQFIRNSTNKINLYLVQVHARSVRKIEGENDWANGFIKNTICDLD